MSDRVSDLARIERGLSAAAAILHDSPTPIEVMHKSNHDPVTDVDLLIDRTLRDLLLEEGEGWLSEESTDDISRLNADRVWVVDPLDGTKEFLQGLPEWCVSIGLVENGRAVAGGILNPAAGFLAIGAVDSGCWLNGVSMAVSRAASLDCCRVLASRSEVVRGEWQRWKGTHFVVEAMGSVAYKLARVACGLADATWTLVPKHEWDVAAGVALVMAAGGWAVTLDGVPPIFNQPDPLFAGLIAAGPGMAEVLTPDFLMSIGPQPTTS